jgi:hypothetical protein
VITCFAEGSQPSAPVPGSGVPWQGLRARRRYRVPPRKAISNSHDLFQNITQRDGVTQRGHRAIEAKPAVVFPLLSRQRAPDIPSRNQPSAGVGRRECVAHRSIGEPAERVATEHCSTRLVEPLSYFDRIIWVPGDLALGSTETRRSQPFGNIFRGRHPRSVPGLQRTPALTRSLRGGAWLDGEEDHYGDHDQQQASSAQQPGHKPAAVGGEHPLSLQLVQERIAQSPNVQAEPEAAYATYHRKP